MSNIFFYIRNTAKCGISIYIKKKCMSICMCVYGWLAGYVCGWVTGKLENKKGYEKTKHIIEISVSLEMVLGYFSA